MIALGGAIGVGLFLGSAATIGIAGPGVVISYIFGAIIAMIMGYALAEMTSVHPVAGSFGVYAEKYLSCWAGFSVRLSYWFAETIVIGAEVTAVGLYFGYWFPDVPSWIWIAGSSALVLLVNAANVKMFGTVESWFAMVKVIAIVAFIILGGALILDASSTGARNASPWDMAVAFNPADKGRESVWCGFWFAYHTSDRRDNSWPAAQFVSELLTFRVLGLEIVQQEKISSDDGVCREQSRPARYSENAEREDYYCCRYSNQWKRKDFRSDNSHCGHKRQTDEWLTRRTEQFHLLGFSLIRPLQGKPQSRAAISET